MRQLLWYNYSRTLRRVIMNKKLIDIITECTKLKKEEISSDAELTDDLGLSSLDIANIFIEIEEQLGCVATDKEIDKMKTVGDIEAYLTKHLDW
jgi:acyl carrier protein